MAVLLKLQISRTSAPPKPEPRPDPPEIRSAPLPTAVRSWRCYSNSQISRASAPPKPEPRPDPPEIRSAPLPTAVRSWRCYSNSRFPGRLRPQSRSRGRTRLKSAPRPCRPQFARGGATQTPDFPGVCAPKAGAEAGPAWNPLRALADRSSLAAVLLKLQISRASAPPKPEPRPDPPEIRSAPLPTAVRSWRCYSNSRFPGRLRPQSRSRGRTRLKSAPRPCRPQFARGGATQTPDFPGVCAPKAGAEAGPAWNPLRAPADRSSLVAVLLKLQISRTSAPPKLKPRPDPPEIRSAPLPTAVRSWRCYSNSRFPGRLRPQSRSRGRTRLKSAPHPCRPQFARGGATQTPDFPGVCAPKAGAEAGPAWNPLRAPADRSSLVAVLLKLQISRTSAPPKPEPRPDPPEIRSAPLPTAVRSWRCYSNSRFPLRPQSRSPESPDSPPITRHVWSGAESGILNPNKMCGVNHTVESLDWITNLNLSSLTKVNLNLVKWISRSESQSYEVNLNLCELNLKQWILNYIENTGKLPLQANFIEPPFRVSEL